MDDRVSNGRPAACGRASTLRRWVGLAAVAASSAAAACGGSSGGSAAPSNRAPTIAGTPATAVVVGSVYAFTPTAGDADGNALIFGIANPPPWSAFDTTTGRLSGTPTSAHIGTTTGIVITVGDGSLSASLAPFSITVSAAATGSATLTWAPPTTNVDGSPLNDLKGYRIRYGTQPGVYPTVIAVDDPAIASYVVNNLAPGEYFFVVSAVDYADQQSDFSTEVRKTIP